MAGIPWQVEARGVNIEEATPVSISIAFIVKVSLHISGHQGGVRLVTTATGRRRIIYNTTSITARIYPPINGALRVRRGGKVRLYPANYQMLVSAEDFVEFAVMPDGTWLTLTPT